jgi:hypothetical protein
LSFEAGTQNNVRTQGALSDDPFAIYGQSWKNNFPICSDVILYAVIEVLTSPFSCPSDRRMPM